MNLRQKTLLLISLTLAGLIGVLYASLSTIFQGSFAELEERNVHQNVRRVQEAFFDEVETLNTTAADYAKWDATYAFINQFNQDFVQANLLDENFVRLRLNMVLLFNTQGQQVFGKGFNLQQEKEAPISDSFQKYLSPTSLLLKHSNPRSNITGIVLLPEGFLMMSSHPILNSQGTGSIRGSLIMGSYLNDKRIKELAQRTQLSLSVYRVDDTQLPPDFQAVRSALLDSSQKTQASPVNNKPLAKIAPDGQDAHPTKIIFSCGVGVPPAQEFNEKDFCKRSNQQIPIIIRPLSNDAIAGYTLLRDINDKPALLVRADMPREIYQQGQASLRYLIFSLLGVGIIFSVVALFLLEKMVLSRLANLSANVEQIGTSTDLSLRVFVTGKDELTTLGNTINSMLDALESSAQKVVAERERAERLLLNILPPSIAQRLGHNQDTIADSFEEATVLFADIVNFTNLSSHISPTELVSMLNEIFSRFDRLLERYGLEKIKTIGDSYMVVGGLPLIRPDHAEAVAEFALDMQQQIQEFNGERGQTFNMRIGINTGPVVAGVIGLKKFIYDLWGDTVNIASRMESHGIPGAIQVSSATYERLKDKYLLEERGTIDVKGKGEMTTYLLKSKKL